MIVGALSDIGLVREYNEDAMFASLDPNLPLYIVADGMGGHKAGDIASSMAVEIIEEDFKGNSEGIKNPNGIKKSIKNAIERANAIVYKRSVVESNCDGMGTTVVLAYYLDSKFYLGHVGDSRAYIISNNNIRQITEDHTLVNELLKKGNITESEAENHPQRNIITQALGSSIGIKIDILEVDFQNDDILLLCSDGLYNMINDAKILEILKESGSLEKGVRSLVDLANENGGKDNITVIAIKLDNEVLV